MSHPFTKDTDVEFVHRAPSSSGIRIWFVAPAFRLSTEFCTVSCEKWCQCIFNHLVCMHYWGVLLKLSDKMLPLMFIRWKGKMARDHVKCRSGHGELRDRRGLCACFSGTFSGLQSLLDRHSLRDPVGVSSLQHPFHSHKIDQRVMVQ